MLQARLWRDVLWYSVVHLSVLLSVRALCTESFASGSYKLVHLITMMRGRCLLFSKVRGQRSRSFCHTVGKPCRQDTEWAIKSKIFQLGTLNHHDKRKIPIVCQGQRSRSYCHIVGKRCMQDTEWTISSRIIQLDTNYYHNERKMLVVFLRQSLKLMVVL